MNLQDQAAAYFEAESPGYTAKGLLETVPTLTLALAQAPDLSGWIYAAARLHCVLLASASALRFDASEVSGILVGGSLEGCLRALALEPASAQGVSRSLLIFDHMLKLKGVWKSQVRLAARRGLAAAVYH